MSTEHHKLGSNTSRLIWNLYSGTKAFQWARELLVNAKFVLATKVTFGLLETHDGVRKRTVIDDGPGMLPLMGEAEDPDLRDGRRIMADLFDLGESQDEDDRFGIGAKIATLGWNLFGVLYVSRAVYGDDLVTSVAWLAVDDGEAVLRRILMSDGSLDSNPVVAISGAKGDDVEWDEVAVEHIKGTAGVDVTQLLEVGCTGTAVVLMGNKRDDDTSTGNPRYDKTESSSRAIVRFLNERFVDLGDLDVTVEYVHNQTTGQVSSRKAVGLEARITQYLGTSLLTGNVHLDDGTSITWYVDRERVEQKIAGDPLKPYSDDTVPQGWSRLVVVDQGEAFSQRYKRLAFGLSSKFLRENIWIVVTPPHADVAEDSAQPYGVHMDPTRSYLILEGGDEDGSLPMAKWAEGFRKAFPDELKKIQEQLNNSGESAEADKAIDEYMQDYVQTELSVTPGRPKIIDTPAGDIPGELTGESVDTTGGGGGGGGHGGTPGAAGAGAGVITPADGGSRLGRLRRQHAQPMLIRPVSKDQMDEPGEIVELVAEADVHVMHVNRDHEYVRSEVEKAIHDFEGHDGEQIAVWVQKGIGAQAVIAHGRLIQDRSVDKSDKAVGSERLSAPVLSMAARVPNERVRDRLRRVFA